MHIALCDDDLSSQESLAGFVRAFARSRELEVRIDRFTCGEDLLAACRGSIPYDILFMDIYLTRDGTRADGIDTIRKLNLPRNRQVVFTTSSRTHAIEAFGLNATHYLVKPLGQEQVTEAMERCIERLGQRLSRAVEVRTKQGTVSVPTENIVYIEVFNKISIIHTARNAIQTYASLDSLFELLDGKVFMRPHRSYIVNMNHIREFFSDHLVLSDGTSITLSRNSRAELKQQYQRFLFDLARRGEI